MNPLNYATPSLHNVLAFAAMAAATIVCTYAVSYIWARWRQRQNHRTHLQERLEGCRTSRFT